jgi:hypothetical protein
MLLFDCEIKYHIQLKEFFFILSVDFYVDKFICEIIKYEEKEHNLVVPIFKVLRLLCNCHTM